MRFSDWSSNVCSSDLLASSADQLARGRRKPESEARLGQRRAHCGGKRPGRRNSSSSSCTSASQPSAPAKRIRHLSPSRAIVPVARQDSVVPKEEVTAKRHFQIGRAHVCTPVTHAHLVCRLLLEKQ